MLERQVKDYLVSRCKALGIYHRKFTSPGAAGVLDWILVNNGKVLFLELKAGGKHPSPAQQREIDRLTHAGAYATVASSPEEIEFLLAFLTES